MINIFNYCILKLAFKNNFPIKKTRIWSFHKVIYENICLGHKKFDWITNIKTGASFTKNSRWKLNEYFFSVAFLIFLIYSKYRHNQLPPAWNPLLLGNEGMSFYPEIYW